jgi:putative membrane protein
VSGFIHSFDELSRTIHPRVGKFAVAAWSVSLAFGIVTYLMLNHVYEWEILQSSMKDYSAVCFPRNHQPRHTN